MIPTFKQSFINGYRSNKPNTGPKLRRVPGSPSLHKPFPKEWSAEAQLHAYILVVAVGVNDLLGVIKYKYLLNVVLFQEITYLFNYVIVP